mmetsp:Transcript_24958/g.57855  ORF Transcript_24958/g.57855 Transcript_24958/m.57855 type:complete len:515 (-) Transcript_24958:282-1826(-)|eukprot:CAMPEP_0182558660 /NCGR_PEP_ID=MMETSP1324-20130603/2084_1 /TAXON_ID=236786 /ORGANISM="Florenciella sp., Strain RCC1587" /LENGTH=514 /DNA_ID=CAMNT_0024770843 /DNA_START=77 /DNA_END=1621 /DNA_ORIENTATION=+
MAALRSAVMALLLGVASSTSSSNTSNVLMIVIDDLRPMISDMEPERFGFMHTPNLNDLMKDSLVMRQSHVQEAVCGPSRTSFLTGRRPDTTHVYDLFTYFRDVGCADCKTIPELFKDEGYRTWNNGKIFHPGLECGGEDTDVQSWTETPFYGDDAYNDGTASITMVTDEMAAENACQDTQILANSLEALQNATASGDPWFIAVGFHKPHLSFAVPEEYFELYPNETIELATNPYAPAGMPAVAYASWELENYDDVADTGFAGKENETLVDWKAYAERQAYQAAVSFQDANVGTLMAELKSLGVWDTTVIALVGDHGFKLGEHGAWTKHTNFDLDTTTPFFLRVPGVTDGGIITQALVEHVDLMPSLAEAAGIPLVDMCPEDEPWLTARCSEGISVLPLVTNGAATKADWKNASYSQYPRDASSDMPIMGYSMTTSDDLRFTAWVEFDYSTNTTSWAMSDDCSRCGLELYNHTTDADENMNLAYHDGMEDTVAEQFAKLKAGWRSTLTAIPTTAN